MVIGKKDASIRTLMISNEFATSPFFSGEKQKTTLLPDIAEAYFGKHFRIEEAEDGSLSIGGFIGEDRILSRARPGEPADFNECIKEIIDKHPQKDALLKGGKPGSGGGGNLDDAESGDVSVLKKQHAKAMEDGNVSLAVSLNTQIHALEHPAT